MSDVINQAVSALGKKLDDNGFEGSIKVEINGEGSLIIDENGVRSGDADVNCTLTADAETFVGMLEGNIDPTSAFMTGKLSVDGDMGVAMKLGALLS